MAQDREQRRKQRFLGVKSLNTWGWESGKPTERINVEDAPGTVPGKGVNLRIEAQGIGAANHWEEWDLPNGELEAPPSSLTHHGVLAWD